MNLITIGTCSLCGGPVKTPNDWCCVIPAVPACENCGATQAQHGPVIPMIPIRQLPWKDIQKWRTYDGTTFERLE